MSTLNIYHLTRPDNDDWDVADGFVIVAKSPTEARKIAGANAGNEGAATWQLPTTKCNKIGEGAGPSRMVIRDLIAG